MNKKYLFLAFGIGIVLLIFILIVLSVKKPAGSQIVNQNSQQVKSLPADSVLTITQGPQTQQMQNSGPVTPEDVAKQLTDWYFSYPGNPVSSRAYKASVLLSDRFKQVIEYLAGNSAKDYDPVFCAKNKTGHYSIDPAIYNNTGTQATVIIRQTISGGKGLYRVVLVYTKNSWLINDIICLP